MLDIRLVREQPDFVKAGLEKVGTDPAVVDRRRQLDEDVRAPKTVAETNKADLNVANEAMGKISPEERENKRAELRALGDLIKEIDTRREEAETALQNLLLEIPNLPH